MAVLFEVLLSGVSLLLLVLAAVLFAEALVAVTARNNVTAQGADRPRLCVLMPAHDEASIIANALRSIAPQLSSGDRLVVVADNCSDETAVIGAAEGAEVVERRDLRHRGKGFALDFGLRHLGRDAPQIVIIVDADCEVAPGSINQLACLCGRTGRPVQGRYLMQAPKGAGLLTRIAEFAWTVKNEVRPRGLRRLGLPCQLMGSGMALPWSCVSAMRLATEQIVEDLKLGIDLARAGMPALFCPEALVTSFFPGSDEGIRGQRRRWEHGHLSMIFREGPGLFLDSITKRNVSLMALALDLSVPPLSLLTFQVTGVWFVGALLFLITKATLPLAIATLAVVLLVLSVLLSWARYGRRSISLADLAMAVAYGIRKIPLYVQFLLSRQVEWVRSKRDGEGKAPRE